jgi:hypothetical protein
MTPVEIPLRHPDRLPLGLEPRRLFQFGLGRVRAFARQVWTDHNVHDPGITILEILCYALTDLAYRADLPIEDLLAAANDNRKSMASQFFTARRALPNRPLTEPDYRRLLIDVPGVRNAWIFPAEQVCYADAVKGELLEHDPGEPGVREVRLRGLYRALIELADDRATPAEEARVIAAARRELQRNRNLCEDFVDVAAAAIQDFLLCGEIELAPQADPIETHARILLAVQRHLALGVPRYTRDEMLKRATPDGTPWTDPELFDGPAPLHGFIDPSELAAAALRRTIRLSDVISEIMDVEGVRAVRDVVVRPADVDVPSESKWEVSVAEGRRARLDAERSRLILYKGGMPLPRPDAVLIRYDELREEDEVRFAGLPADPEADDAKIPLGRYRNLAGYQPLQDHFPAVYGVGEAELPGDAGIERRAQAMQLQGYLLFLDQVLANDCAQLASARELFSFFPNLQHSYFSQVLQPFGRFASHYAAASEQEARELLDSLLETPEAMIDRRNRFLDHLLARFAERLQDYLDIERALFDATPLAAAVAKAEYLRDYPELGAERGLAFDYTADPELDSTNTSGLQRRLRHLLGLGTYVKEIYQEHDEDGVDEYRWRLRPRIGDGVLLSSETRYLTVEEAVRKMGEAISAAHRASAYQLRETVTGELYFNIVDEGGNVIARRIQYFRTAEARNAAITRLIELLEAHEGERMLVIENILLRPRPGAANTFLPICAHPECGPDCPGDDPYSYRLHIVVPAGAGRFRNMEFRRFAEEIIRQETPAHLLPKICWVDERDIADIEAAWRAWRLVLARDETGAAAKLAALRDALFKAKNIYPARTLADCQAEEKFILGRTALGSAPPSE